MPSWGGREVCSGPLGDSRSLARPSTRVGNPWCPAPRAARREGVRGGGNTPPTARGLARAHPSRPGRAARGLAGPRGCSWALLETSNAGSDSSPTARMQEPPLPPRLHPTPPPSAEPERRGRASQRASERGGGGSGGRRCCGVPLQAPHAPRRRTLGQVHEGWARAARGRGWAGAGRRRARAGRPISTRALLHTHSQLTRGRGDKDTHGAQETKARSRRPRGAVLEAEGGAGPGGSHGNRHRGCRRAEGGAPAH